MAELLLQNPKKRYVLLSLSEKEVEEKVKAGWRVVKDEDKDASSGRELALGKVEGAIGSVNGKALRSDKANNLSVDE